MRPRLQAAAMAALLAVALGCYGWAGYAAWSTPASATVEHVRAGAVLTAGLRLNPAIELRRSTLLWPAGTRLPGDRPLYSYAGDPVIELAPVVSVTGAGGSAGTVQVQVTVHQAARNLAGEVLWSDFLQSQADAADLRWSEPWVGAPLHLAVGPLRERFLAIAEELGFRQAVQQLELAVDATLTARVDGRRQEWALHLPVHIRFEQEGFSFQPAGGWQVQEQIQLTRREQVTRPRPVSERFLAAPLQLAAGSLLLSLWLVAAGWRRRRARANRALTAAAHRRLRDWITPGRVAGAWRAHTGARGGDATGAASGAASPPTPPNGFTPPEGPVVIAVDDLEGLVDIAIDMRKRVIYDRSEHSYHVLDGSIVYTHRPAPATASAGEAGQTTGTYPTRRRAARRRAAGRRAT